MEKALWGLWWNLSWHSYTPHKTSMRPLIWASNYSHKVLFSSITASIAFIWALSPWISFN